jgi:exopolyphosphatase/guanosine-5'-triphosphate,3'-diphosphate pyrophosphatase
MMDHIEDAKREVPRLIDAVSVTLAGPIAETIVAIEIGAPAVDRRFTLTRDASEDVFRTMATESSADRRHNPGLPSDLVGVIVGGCCAVVGLIRGLHLDSVEVVIEAAGQGS